MSLSDNQLKLVKGASSHKGVTLIETVVFIVVVSIATVAFTRVYYQSMVNSVSPVLVLKATEKAQAILDEVLSRRFDENSPTGGIPQCDSSTGIACAGISADLAYDDVGDYQGYSDSSDPGYSVDVSVTNAGGDLGILAAHARLISVTVTMPNSKTLTLSAYRVNY